MGRAEREKLTSAQLSRKLREEIRQKRKGKESVEETIRRLAGLLIVAIALIFLVVPVLAMQFTFQDTSEYSSNFNCIITTGGSCAYTYSTTGGNSYVTDTASACAGSCFKSAIIRNNNPSQTTYAAASVVSFSGSGSGGVDIILYDSSLINIYEYQSSTISAPSRFEIVVAGGVANIYQNGKLIASSTALSQNPSYIGWGAWNAYGFAATTVGWDDIVYGTTENKYIFGMPEHGFVIIKDTIGGAGSGFYYPNETTIISNYNITSTWGKGTDNTSVTVGLYNVEIQNSPKCTFTTIAGTMAGSYAWPLQDCLFNNANASQGYYYTTVYGSGTVSDTIVYKGKGATVSLDKNFYSTGEPATGTWAIDGAPYWDTTTYNYAYRIVDLYGNEKYSTAITSQTGSAVYTWLTVDTEGVYYAEVIATPKAGGGGILMAYDSATLSGTFSISGYVNEDESTLPISGALVNFTQGSIRVNTTSATDGGYNVTGFTTGTKLWYNASATNYQPFNYSFTPQYAHSLVINITLPKNTHTGTGIFAGGVVHDMTYARPIANTLVPIENQTDKQYYTAYTNNAGFYNKTSLTYLDTYNIWGSKTGYANSTIYKKLMTGML
jgi:hypothetical protein